jgi:tetratricopeptide (TPR) repeat protein
LGNVYDSLNDRKLAERELKKAIEFKPDYPEALNYLGYMYAEQGKNLNDAEAMIKRALEIDPDNGAYIDSLGWVYFKKGRISEALNKLEQAIALYEDPIIYDHLGDVYLKMGNMDKAKSNWQKVLDLKPDQEDLQNKVKEKLGQLNQRHK